MENNFTNKSEVNGGGIGSESINPARQSCLRFLAIKIVNVINDRYNLNLLTVDASAMTDDVFELLNSEQNAEECDATTADQGTKAG